MNTATHTATFVKGPIGSANILTATDEWMGTSTVILGPE